VNGSWCEEPVPLPLDAAVVAVGPLPDELEEVSDEPLEAPDDALDVAGAEDELGPEEEPLELDPELELELAPEPEPEPLCEPPEPPEDEGGWVYWLSPAEPPPSASVTAGAASASNPSRPRRIINWRHAVMA
jgi:hypothetical protein